MVKRLAPPACYSDGKGWTDQWVETMILRKMPEPMKPVNASRREQNRNPIAFLELARIVATTAILAIPRLGYVVAGASPFILAALAPTTAIAQHSGEYRLGAQDRLSIKIGRWRPAEGVYESWDGLGGEYVVGPDGLLSIALAGTVPAEGHTITELAEEISRRIQRRVGMVEPPSTSVEVIEFRPFYVVGAVNSPGEFPFRPQMTVLQAVGLAGGHLRAAVPLLRPERETLIEVREYEVLRLQRFSLIAQLARLSAELAGAEELTVPEELEKYPDAAEMLRTEADILAARSEALKSEKLAIEEFRRLLGSTIESLGKEIKLRTRQLALAREELNKLKSLANRGLVTASRESNFARQVVDLEAKQITLEVARLTAEQQLNEAIRDELDLVNDRRRSIVTELRETRQRLEETEVRFRTAEALVSEVASLGGNMTMTQSGTGPTYRLMRRVEGQTLTLTVDEQDLIQPGDTLKVFAPTIEPGMRPSAAQELPG